MLIILYILLACTDTFTYYANRFKTHPNIIHPGILATIIFIFIVIVSYLFSFIAELIEIGV